MSAKDEALTGEVMHAADYQEGGKAFLFHCGECGRMVLNEAVFVDEMGELHCTGCMDTGDLSEFS